MKKLSLILLFLACSKMTMAQDNPFRVGIKLGSPMIAGLNVEYLTPIAGGRLAPSVDFSRFSISLGDTESSFGYFEFGGNFYFKDTGKGAYANLSYGLISWKGTFSDPVLGTAEVKTGLSRANLKIGAKLGKRFYFRPELGYAIGFGNNEIEATYTAPDGTTATETEEVPGLLIGGFIGNIGIGFAF